MFVVPRLDPAGAACSRTILIVEDEALIRMSLAEHLRDCGFVVLEAANGEEAQALILGQTPVELVFTDVQMPGRLDGLALGHWLNETYPRIDLMITSGMIELTDRAALFCDAASVFAKPYDHQEVTARMRALLN
jgi:DNA-binding response OmpR family regulator